MMSMFRAGSTRRRYLICTQDGFDLSSGRGRNPASSKSACEPREAESLRVFGGAAAATVEVAAGLAHEASQTESTAGPRLVRNTAWLAELWRDDGRDARSTRRQQKSRRSSRRLENLPE
jgi:hypothetical protein